MSMESNALGMKKIEKPDGRTSFLESKSKIAIPRIMNQELCY